MSLTSSCVITLSATALSSPDIGTATYAIAEQLTAATLTTGGAINQASYVWSDRRTLTTATSDNIDMYAPAVRDALGQTLTLSKIKLLYIKNRSVTAGDYLLIGGNGTGATWNSLMNASDTAKLYLEPGGTILVVSPSAAGLAVANTTNHLLKIENPGANSVDYDIIIVGH